LIYKEIKKHYDPYRVASVVNPNSLKLVIYETQIEITELHPSSDSLHLLVAGVDPEGMIVCPHFMSRCRDMRFKSVGELREHNRLVADELRYLCE
jgi:hypothetical protein